MTKKHGEAHPVDIHVGMMLRKRRQELGISQEELASYVNLTFQQIQKYEKGLNRISSSKLHDFAKFLKTSIQYFFKGLSEYEIDSRTAPNSVATHENESSYQHQHEDIYAEIAELVRAFHGLKDHKVRHSIIQLAQSLSDSSNNAGHA